MRFYVRMRGGLGNQMFQYAYALALRERYPDAEIWLDTREYRTYKRRVFELADFVLDRDTFLFSEGKLRYDAAIRVFHVYQRLYREIRKKQPYGLSEAMARRGILLTGLGCPLPESQLPEETFLYGYFQNIELLVPLRAKLQEIYSVPEKVLAGLPSALRQVGDNSVAVSIRLGGDMVRSGWQLCSRDYYREGLARIRREHRIDRVLIFSDDPERVSAEKWFDDLGLDLTYATALSPAEQMSVLKQCRHFVISNSTFAWWGAFLGAGEDEGVIVAPTFWQGNRSTAEDSLYLKNMILLQ